ncbi:MAG: 16S rRNA (guanine(527)-N(7))-methyltransferase RsmG [Eubacterium sp.]|nr:16S rRNA (guanine(527)-N(7))-methyltransferase RsmG [Eubacterium sp.]
MKELFSNYSIDINDEQINKFNKYYKLLIEWNKKINLTTITDYEDVIKKHFLDSVLLLKVFKKDLFVLKNIIDVGTGAGFPGVPLAIMLPDAKFTLVDSLNKRIQFLKEVIEILGIDNITLIHARAEELGVDANYREKYDICVSRAVAALPLLLEYCSPFIKKEGVLYMYKSVKVEEEINSAENALSILNCSINKNILLSDENDFIRYILEIVKEEATPDKYPRKPGKAKKAPL